jgi:aminopeptidase
MDSRYTKLADLLTAHSTRLKRGDRVMIDAFDAPESMVVALVRSVRARGAVPVVQLHQARVTRELLREATVPQYKTLNALELQRLKRMQAYIAIRGSHNIFENADVPPARMKMAMAALRPALNWRVNKTRWVVLRWPTAAMAQQAGLSSEAFEDFYFSVCTLDYGRFAPGMAALKALMNRTDCVHLEGPGVDLRFSIKGIGAVSCGGEYNVPDGEVFSAPVKNSVEGEITFNAPTVYQGVSFDRVKLVFKEGRIVEASAAAQSARLQKILDSDAGARYVGEFAIAFNPLIREPMRDILFDEKIAGSFHFTPGQAYEQADNGNRSQVHWDLVSIQRPEYGGGTISFDGRVIRRDGLFLPAPLRKLNPDYLLGKKK